MEVSVYSERPGRQYPGLFYERRVMEFHEIANAFPLMEGEEFRELAEDIARNGQQQPILTYEGKILDGRNRYRACIEAGEEPWVEPWVGDNPVEAVLSFNLHRRHLTSSQKAMIAERMLPHLEEEAKKRRGHGRTAPGRTLGQKVDQASEAKEDPSVKDLTNGTPANEGKAVSEAAKLTGTNRQYVSDAKKLRGEDPDKAEKVERGEVSLPAATGKRQKRSQTKRSPEPLEGEDRTPAREAIGEDIDLPPWDLTPEQKAYWNISKHLVAISKLDPEVVAQECSSEEDVDKRIRHVRAISDWFGRYEQALEGKRKELRPGNLRVVGGENG